MVYIKTDDIYKNIAEDIDNNFDDSNYQLGRPLDTSNTFETLL